MKQTRTVKDIAYLKAEKWERTPLRSVGSKSPKKESCKHEPCHTNYGRPGQQRI
jgi:hypothetical protein